MKTLITIVSLLFIPPITVLAQKDTTGTISGAVINAQEVPVSNARVAVYDQQGITALTNTNERGKFMTDHIGEGMYEVHVIARGYKRSVVTKVPVKAGKNSTVPVKIFEKRSPEDTIYVYSTYQVFADEFTSEKKQSKER